MDKKYTIEDVEALRERTGISYEEAVALLDKYDGDMSRALIELEKRGVLNDKKTKRAGNTEGFGAWLKRFLNLSIITRLHITKDDTTIANLSALFLIAFVCFAPWLAIAALILVFLLGLRVNVIKNSDLYASATLKSMVDGAGENLKANVDNLTNNRPAKEEDAAGEAAEEPGENHEEVKRPEAAPEKNGDEDEDGDYESVTIE